MSVSTLEQLRARVEQMQGHGREAVAMPTHPDLASHLRLQTGGIYAVSSMSAAMLLMAGPSAEGAWSAVVGLPHFGLEAAAERGIRLDHTVLVPEPGEHWLDVVTTLAGAVQVVVLRPTGVVSQRQAAVVRAKLRRDQALLASVGVDWPQVDAVVSQQHLEWFGIGQGHGHLQRRSSRIDVQIRGRRPAFQEVG